MDPAEYLRIVRRRWLVILACFLVGVGAALATTPDARPKTALPRAESYTATHTLFAQIDVDAGRQSRNNSRLQTYALLATNGIVPVMAAEELGEKQPAELAAAVDVQANTQQGTIEVTASDKSAERAKLLSDTFATKLVEYLDGEEQKKIDLQIDNLEEQAALLKVRLDQVRPRTAEPGAAGELAKEEQKAILNEYNNAVQQLNGLKSRAGGSGLDTLQAAVPLPGGTAEGFTAPTSRSTRMAIAGLIGLILGAGFALVLERFDTRLRSKVTAEGATGLPVLAEIPRISRRLRRHGVVTAVRPSSMFAEAYRQLRTSLRHMQVLAGVGAATSPADQEAAGALAPLFAPVPAAETLKVVLVTSPGTSEGKTTTVANLAIAFAETGQSVIALECDLSRPMLAERFGVDPVAGVSDLLQEGSGSFDITEYLVDTPIQGIRLLAAGNVMSSQPALVSHGEAVIEQARQLADVVLIDTPPLLLASETSELARCADVVVLVTRAGRTTGEAAGRASELLARLGAPVIGAVITDMQENRKLRRRYYRYDPYGPRNDRFGGAVPSGNGDSAAVSRKKAAEPAEGAMATARSRRGGGTAGPPGE